MLNHVELERSDVVGRLVLNRPERRNALSQEVMDAMLQALDIVASDKTTRVLVIEGRGPAYEPTAQCLTYPNMARQQRVGLALYFQSSSGEKRIHDSRLQTARNAMA